VGTWMEMGEGEKSRREVGMGVGVCGGGSGEVGGGGLGGMRG